MAYTARRTEYFYATISGEPSDAYEVLGHLAALGVNFVAVTAVPLSPTSTQFTLFPEDPLKLQSAAKGARLTLNGPHEAVLVQGDDEIGALARIHRRLRDAGVQVYASSGVADGRGRYGCILYLRPQDAEEAARALAD